MAKRNSNPSPTAKALAMMKTYGRCAYCGKKLGDENLTFDHIIPYSKQGTNTAENLYAACQACNQLRADLTIEDFRKVVTKEMQETAEKLMTSGSSAKEIMLKSYMNINIQVKPVVFFYEKLARCKKTTDSFEAALDKIEKYTVKEQQ